MPDGMLHDDISEVFKAFLGLRRVSPRRTPAPTSQTQTSQADGQQPRIHGAHFRFGGLGVLLRTGILLQGILGEPLIQTGYGDAGQAGSEQ